MEKVATIGRWPLYGGQNEWGKALLGLTKVAFIERWPYYRVATIRRFHCFLGIVNPLSHCIIPNAGSVISLVSGG